MSPLYPIIAPVDVSAAVAAAELAAERLAPGVEPANSAVGSQAAQSGVEDALARLNAQRVKAAPTTGAFVRPSLANAVSLAGGVAVWAFGAWAEATAGEAFDWYLTQLYPQSSSPSVVFEIEIGLGGAGSEVHVASLVLRKQDSTNYVPPIPLVPWLWVPAGTRVAIRVADDNAASQTMSAKVFGVRASDLEASSS